MLSLRVWFAPILSSVGYRVSKKAMFLEPAVKPYEKEIAAQNSFHILEFTFHRYFLELAIVWSEKFWIRVDKIAIEQNHVQI